jgi:hypothetical protein
MVEERFTYSLVCFGLGKAQRCEEERPTEMPKEPRFGVIVNLE